MTYSYDHKQTGTLTLAVVGFFVVLLLIATRWYLGWPQLVILALLALVVANFHSLRVRVDREAIHLRFGIGWIRRSIPLDSVAGVAVVRNHWFFGWGIRWIPRGWMWNVSGLDAVELRYPTGRRFRIGTDDPEALAQAIWEAREACR